MSKRANKSGKVYLVGAGPGDLGLVTLRAKECIENADVIAYDHLANPDMLGWARDDAEIIYAGKQPGESQTQQEITSLLIDKAREEKQVVRLKGGDPFVFGRGAEEAQKIATAGIAFEIVPGITSAIAGPAYAGIPMTHRAHNSHVTFFTGHEDPTKTESAIDYAALAKLGGTQVMLMGVEHLGAVTSEMLKHGVREDFAVGDNGRLLAVRRQRQLLEAGFVQAPVAGRGRAGDQRRGTRCAGGGAENYAEGAERYLSYLAAAMPVRLDGLTVVVDCAHGAASLVGPEALRRAGASVIAIAAEGEA